MRGSLKVWAKIVVIRWSRVACMVAFLPRQFGSAEYVAAIAWSTSECAKIAYDPLT